MNNQVKDTYYYQPTTVSGLGAALAQALEGLGGGDDSRYVKSATVNSILAVPTGTDSAATEDLINTLTEVHPNRTFLIVLDETNSEPKVELSTRCHKISQTEHVCSEVIRFTCSPAKLSAAKSIVRAHLLTGMPTELVLNEESGALQTYREFREIAEQVIFSSELFERDFQSLRQLLESEHNLIDLQWVAIGNLREQVKEVFDLPLVIQQIRGLRDVEISCGAQLSSALLIGGWIVDRLGMIPLRKNGDRLAFTSYEGQEVGMRIIKGGSANELSKLSFSFESGGSINIEKRNMLETEININGQRRISRPIERLSYEDLVRRYFFIGESTSNYRSSLSHALKIDLM